MEKRRERSLSLAGTPLALRYRRERRNPGSGIAQHKKERND